MSVWHEAWSRNEVGLHKKMKGRVIPMETTSLSKRKSPRPVRNPTILYYIMMKTLFVCIFVHPSVYIFLLSNTPNPCEIVHGDWHRQRMTRLLF